MMLSLTSWSFPACTLQEAADISRALGIGALDIGLFYRSAIDRSELLSDPRAAAEKVSTLGVRVPNFYYLFGHDMRERNLAMKEHIDENCRDFEKALMFCRHADIGTIFMLPGMVGAGQSRQQAQAASVRSLQALMSVARDYSTKVTIEPTVHSVLESPQDVLGILERVEGLKLTLDYAHFACLGYRQHETDILAPHAAHVHLRQARPGALQTRGAEGTINMMAQFGTLRDAGYSGALSLEYVHQDYMGTLNEDVLTETIALRDIYREWAIQN